MTNPTSPNNDLREKIKKQVEWIVSDATHGGLGFGGHVDDLELIARRHGESLSKKVADHRLEDFVKRAKKECHPIEQKILDSLLQEAKK